MCKLRAVRRVIEQGRRAPYNGKTVRFRLPTLSIFNKQKLPEVFGSDLRTLGPLHICSCGCTVFNIMAAFEDYELVWYFLDGTCASCGNLLTIPCPIDDPEK
jgi:hypothetical protein